jgi:hypothetical protein
VAAISPWNCATKKSEGLELSGKEETMLKVERLYAMNFENAIRGARNPMNSWDRMDSVTDEKGNFILGENDRKLARKLARAGSDHRKF